MTVITTSQGVTLIGGGDVSANDLALALAAAPVLVAADSGADAALALGHLPKAVFGDFDSISAEARAQIDPAHQFCIPEQDSTDFTKALTRIDAPFVIAIGFTGRRLDHQLATLTAMMVHQSPPCLLLSPEEVIFVAPPHLDLPVAIGTRVSLYPLGPARGRSNGLQWPIEGIEFTPAGRVGTSNQAIGPVRLDLEGPMLILLPRDCLEIAIAALI